MRSRKNSTNSNSMKEPVGKKIGEGNSRAVYGHLKPGELPPKILKKLNAIKKMLPVERSQFEKKVLAKQVNAIETIQTLGGSRLAKRTAKIDLIETDQWIAAFNIFEDRKKGIPPTGTKT